MKRKLISVTLFLAILLSLVPASAFAGDADAANAALETDETAFTADSSFGGLLLNTVEGEEEPAVSENTASKVSSLKLDGKTATVEFTTEVDAELVVAIYEEDGYKMLGSGRTKVYAGDVVATVEVEIEQMPEYFRCAAFIMDAETFQPLSEEYTSREYTLEFQQFLAKTVDDFDEARVLNLDDDRANNFAVYGEDTLVVFEEGTDMSVEADGSGVYVIHNASKEIRALRAGDSLAYNCADGTVYVLIVGTVSVSGSTVTITENAEAELADVFDYVKIDTNGENATYEVDNSSLPEGVTPIDYVDPDALLEENVRVRGLNEKGEYETFTAAPIVAATEGYQDPVENSGTIKLSYDLNKIETNVGITLTGTLSVSIGYKLKVYIDVDWQYVNLEISPSLSYKGEIKLSTSHTKAEMKMPLAIVPVEIVPGVALDFTQYFVVEPEISGSISIKWDGKLTFCFDSDQPKGDKFNCTKSGKAKITAEIEGKIFMGLELEAKLSLVADKLSEVSISAKAGAELSGKLEPKLDPSESGMAHTCKLLSCLGGDLSLVVSGSAKASFLNCESLTISGSVTAVKLKLMDFYWHLGSGEGIVWNATCPNKQYDVNITALDGKKKPVTDADVNIVTKYGEKVFSVQPSLDEKGKCSFYLPNGEYVVTLTADGAFAEYAFQVDRASKYFDITLKPNGVADGTCGESAVWVLTREGTLIISGTGAVRDFDESSAPWADYTVKKLVVNSGITRLGNNAFAKLDIKTVILPETLMEIGSYALEETDISEITLPTSLKRIERGAFASCKVLKKVFYNGYDDDWEAIVIESNNDPLLNAERKGYGNVYKMGRLGKNGELVWTLENDGTLTVAPAVSGARCSMPDFGLNANRSPWAKYSKEISSVVIKQGVTDIGDYAFAACPELTFVEIPEGVTSIGEAAFASDASLMEISLPKGLETVLPKAFLDCSGLVSITIEEGLKAIGLSAFSGCTGLEKVICNMLEEQVNELKKNIADGNKPLLDAEWSYISVLDSGDFWTLYSNGNMVIFGEMDYTDSDRHYISYDSCASQVLSVEITPDVTYIISDAFYRFRNMESIIIPESIEAVGNDAFSGCDKLENVYYGGDIASWVKIRFEINKWDMWIQYTSNPMTHAEHIYINNELVRDIVIPDGTKTIGNRQFLGWRDAVSLTIPDSVESIEDYAFSSCSSLTSVTIPNGVTSIGSYVFNGCDSLTSITIPNSVTSIGSGTFYYCSSLTSITIPNSVTSISNYAFYYCSSLKNITIPDSVKSIGYYSFYKCSSLESITIPDSVTSIESEAFYECSCLTSVAIGNSVLSIRNKTFYKCSSLASITIGNSVTNIGEYAFYECNSLTSVTIPNSVTSIGIAAFYECSSLASITIGNSVDSIEDSAFRYCASLESITVEKGNKTYLSSGNCLIETASKTLILGCNTSVIPNDGSVTSIREYAFLECGSLESIILPDSVTSIMEHAFLRCTSLRNVTIGNGLTSISDYSFSECSSLENVTIGNSVMTIGRCAFSYCSSLTSITIPDSVTSIGSGAFYECSSLASITIPNGVTSIGSSAFSGCSSLASITIPNGVTSIGRETFKDCSSLTSITLPSSVTSIGRYAFGWCSNLESITFTDSITEIGADAFHSCKSLKDVYYSGTEEQWRAISNEGSNSELFNAHIHYNSMGPESALIPEVEATPEPTPEAEIVLLAAYSGEAGQLEGMRTAHFTDLVPGEEYVFACMKNEALMFKPSNLLYIGQGNADENGELTFSFVPREDAEVCVLRAYGLSSRSIADGEISVWLDEHGLIRTEIIYSGETLTEDKDYTVSLSDNAQGDRVVTLIGKGEFAGEYSAVLHSWVVSQYVIAPTCTEAGSADCVCENCGAEERVELYPLGHDIVKSLVLPTADESGYTLRKCTRCDHEERTDFVDPLRHEAEPTAAVFERDALIAAIPAETESIVFGKRSDCLGEIKGEIGISVSADKFIRVYVIGTAAYVVNESDGAILAPEDCSELFKGREALRSVSFAGFNTHRTKNMSGMFAACPALTELDLSSFATANVTDMSAMFAGDAALEAVYASELFRLDGVTASEDMFLGCEKLVGGAGTAYSPEHTDKTLAKPDAPDSPGYFTYKASPVIPGDLNNDGTVTALDLLRLKKFLAKIISDVDLLNADLNGDGYVNALDLLRLKKQLAGL